MAIQSRGPGYAITNPVVLVLLQPLLASGFASGILLCYTLRDALKGKMWTVNPIFECEVKALSLNDAVGYLVNILRTTKSMGVEVYQGLPS
jgi:hypothetical protein